MLVAVLWLRNTAMSAGAARPDTAFRLARDDSGMKIRLDRTTCIGMFQCVAEWEDGFERDEDEGKVDLLDSDEIEDGIFEREVPEDAELDAKFAARVCPVDAIEVWDDGEQIV